MPLLADRPTEREPFHEIVRPSFYSEGVETEIRRIFRPHGKQTILYVEDDMTDIFLLNSALEATGNGVRLVAFRDPADALVVCAQSSHAPDLIVIDINMPRIGGIELLSRLKALPKFSNTPMAIFTTSTNPAFKTQATKGGADAYLVKPLLFDGYFDAARTLIGLAGRGEIR